MPQFDPDRSALYALDDLFKGFDPDQPLTYGTVPDFAIYREFVQDHGAASTNKANVAARARHDVGITLALGDALRNTKVVAIMGGHQVTRSSDAYKETARVAALLTKNGFLVITGGGPGAMEAAHLGAMVGDAGANLEAALATMAKADRVDISGFPVTYDKATPDMVDEHPDVIKALGEYYAPGYRLRQKYGHGGGIAIPTWMYGWEPTNVFAGSIAKYFQNSIREDGLLAAATHGVIYAEGRAGTVQEIFQDAAQNYYHTFPAPTEQRPSDGLFSPMIFLGRFWQWVLPIEPIIQSLFTLGGIKPDEARRILFTDDIHAAVKLICEFQGPISPPAFK